MANRLPARTAGLVFLMLGTVLGCSGEIRPSSPGASPAGSSASGATPEPGFSPSGAPALPMPMPSTTTAPPAVPAPAASDDGVFFATATRRLTKAELRQTLLDLTAIDLASELAKFPEDFAEAGDVFAFDNKYTHQQPSPALIEAARNLADVVGARVLSDAELVKRIVPCTPSGPDDQACLRKFFETFGRHVLRRPLASDEIERYATKLGPFAIESKSFTQAVSLGVRALLQDVEFLYRPEVGQPVQGQDGLFKLTGAEVASRLSYFLWGTAPDDALLATALSGDKLGSPAAIQLAARGMLADPRAKRGVERFHALWLGWERQPPPAALGAAMKGESAALLQRVIFEQRASWLELFRAKDTYVDAALAAHYGLPPPPGGAGWISYGASGRQGILSHAAFLGVERKHSDTSPTMRGQFIRTRLMCQPVPPPPPDLMIDIDAVPTEGNCKSDRYSMWKKDGCKGCHTLMDPIGHGLENYDSAGAYRAIAPSDAGKAGCEISGQGEVQGTTLSDAGFTGVAGLADKLVDSGGLESCLGVQLASFMLGRSPAAEELDLFTRVGARFAAGGRHFDDLLLDIVSLPGFGYRRAE